MNRSFLRALRCALKVVIHTTRTKCQIPICKAFTGIDLGNRYHPSIKDHLPAERVGGVDVSGRESVPHLWGNINSLNMATEVAPDSLTINDSALGSRADSAEKLVSIGKSQSRVIHHLSPDLIEEAQHRRTQALMVRDMRRLEYENQVINSRG